MPDENLQRPQTISAMRAELIFSGSKTENLKSYVAVNHEDRTQSKPSARTFKMSSTLRNLNF